MNRSFVVVGGGPRQACLISEWSALAPLSSHTTARPDGLGTSFGSQTNNGRQTVREPARQDLSTLRASRNVWVDHQSDG
jgi:hypothetical protein